MNIFEVDFICRGAVITGGPNIVVDYLGNQRHYAISEVDPSSGAVIWDEDGQRKVDIDDIGQAGVRVLRGVNDIPRLGPGQMLDIYVGSNQVAIQGTAYSGVLYNNTKPNFYDDALRLVRFPPSVSTFQI